jgi:hypothetical protein
MKGREMPEASGASSAAKIVSMHGDEAGWVGNGEIRFNALYFGAGERAIAPVAVFMKAGPNVGDHIAGLRTHPTPVVQTVIDGAAQLDGRWCAVGDMQVVDAGVGHGDLVVGPQGVTLMTMFAERSGLVPAFADPEDQTRYDTTCRGDVEAVASGAAQNSFVFLPPRPDYTPRRGIKIVDPAITAVDEDAESALFERAGITWTSVDDDNLPWGQKNLNARSALIVLGARDNETAPVVGVVSVGPGPGDRLRGRHTHASAAVNLVIEGALYMDGVWLRPGEAKIVPAEFEYGDGLVGPEGVKFLEIWADQFGVEPAFVDPDDRAFFEYRKAGGHLQNRMTSDRN